MKRNAGRLGGIMILGVVMLMIMAVSAGALPSYEGISDLAGLSRPIQVSVDTDGNVYVGEKVAKRVTKYSSSGSPLYTVALPTAATAVKIASNGLLYIGIPNSILVYSGTQQVNIIEGVVRPVAIDIAANGNLYVLDAATAQIKIMTSAGALIGNPIGNYESLGQDLRDLMIDEANSEFYVLDRNGIYTDQGGAVTRVWRVQAFDMSGNTLREFSHYGYNVEGALVSATNFAIDGQRRIYIADNVQNIIGVYDHTGAYIGTLYDPANPYNAPVTMDYRNDRLYFVSYNGNNLRIIGLEGYANLAVNPATVVLNMQNGVVYGSRSLTLSNTGSGGLQWNLESAPSWLNMATVSGTIGAKSAASNEITVNAASLAGASASGEAMLGFNGGKSKVNVQVNAVAPASLAVSGSTYEFIVQKGASDSNSTTITISNDLSNTIQWSAASSAAWLKASPSTGPSNIPTATAVTVNAAGLATGVYTGTIAINAPGATGSQLLSVKMTVIPAVPAPTSKANSIVATLGGSNDATNVRVFDGQGVLKSSFTAGYKKFKGGLDTAIGDIDGDGNNDIITALQSGGALIKVYTAGGSLITESGALFAGKYGVKVAAADFDGDGKAEIIAASNKGAASVKILGLQGSAIAETGAAFDAGPNSGNSDLHIAAGEFDGEVVVATIMGDSAKGEIKIWSVDTTGGIGNWTEMLKDTIDLRQGLGNNIAGITFGDINDDGENEILIALKQGGVLIVKSDGTHTEMAMTENGLNDIGFSDLNNDGINRIVAGLAKGYVGISTDAGAEVSKFQAFTGKKMNSSVRISTGDLGFEKASLGGVR